VGVETSAPGLRNSASASALSWAAAAAAGRSCYSNFFTPLPLCVQVPAAAAGRRADDNQQRGNWGRMIRNRPRNL
jgi:hypothetical protein